MNTYSGTYSGMYPIDDGLIFDIRLSSPVKHLEYVLENVLEMER